MLRLFSFCSLYLLVNLSSDVLYIFVISVEFNFHFKKDFYKESHSWKLGSMYVG